MTPGVGRACSGAATDRGVVRETNEDRFLADPERGLFIVADGLGGHTAGEIASQTAVDTIRDRLPEAVDAGDADGREMLLETALHAAHDAIRQAVTADESLTGMGTTAVVVWIDPFLPGAWIGHVGDSRAYAVRAGELLLLTEDHTLLNQARMAGVLSADPASWPPRAALSQALGVGDVIGPEVQCISLGDGDRLLLCSDGLTDALEEDEIAEIAGAGEEAQSICEALVASAVRCGARDNVTVVLVMF